MSILTAIIEPDADGTLHLPLPPAWRHQAIRVRAEMEPVGAVPDEHPEPALPQGLQGFGCLKGKIRMAPDFDEPLEDYKDYTA